MERSLSTRSLGDLVAEVHRHVVHDLRAAAGEQLRVELVGQHPLATSRLLLGERGVVEVLHVDPGVGVYVVRARDRRLHVEGLGQQAEVEKAAPALLVDDRFVANGAYQGELDPERGGDRHQRVHHVVVHADVGQACPARVPASILGDRQHVGERLAGVVEVAAPVDDRHRRAADHPEQVRIALQPRHDEGGVAREVARLRTDVAEGEVRRAPVEVDGVPAELRHARLERHPGTGRRLLEDHHQGAALHVALELPALPFHAAGEREHRADVVIVPELPVDEVFRCVEHASGSRTTMVQST